MIACSLFIVIELSSFKINKKINKFEKLFIKIIWHEKLTSRITSRIVLYELRKEFFSIILTKIYKTLNISETKID